MKKSITTINPNRSKQPKKHSIGFVYLQLFLTITLLILGTITLFQKDLFIWFQLLLGITIFDMGINNGLIYKRKYATVLYLVVGLAIIVLFVLRLLGV